MPHLIDETIQALADKTLPTPDAEAASIHIAKCGACTERYKAYVALNEALGRAGPERASDGFTEGVMRLVSERAPAPAHPAALSKRHIGAAALLFAMFLGLAAVSYVYRGAIAGWGAELAEAAPAGERFDSEWTRGFTEAVQQIGEGVKWAAGHISVDLTDSSLLIMGFFVATVLIVFLGDLLGQKIPRRLRNP